MTGDGSGSQPPATVLVGQDQLGRKASHIYLQSRTWIRTITSILASNSYHEMGRQKRNGA
jgi:hypothetical protein